MRPLLPIFPLFVRMICATLESPDGVESAAAVRPGNAGCEIESDIDRGENCLSEEEIETTRRGRRNGEAAIYGGYAAVSAGEPRSVALLRARTSRRDEALPIAEDGRENGYTLEDSDRTKSRASPGKSRAPVSEENKRGWLYPRAGRTSDPSSRNNIWSARRPIRVPFDDWGGKRASIVRARPKGTVGGGDDRLERIATRPIDALEAGDRQPEPAAIRRETRFDGRRGREGAGNSEGRNDREEYYRCPMDATTRGPGPMAPFSSLLPASLSRGGFASERDDARRTGCSENQPGPAKVYRGDALLLCARIVERDDRSTSMPGKRAERHGQYKKNTFDPWGGKRSLKMPRGPMEEGTRRQRAFRETGKPRNRGEGGGASTQQRLIILDCPRDIADN